MFGEISRSQKLMFKLIDFFYDFNILTNKLLSILFILLIFFFYSCEEIKY